MYCSMLFQSISIHSLYYNILFMCASADAVGCVCLCECVCVCVCVRMYKTALRVQPLRGMCSRLQTTPNASSLGSCRSPSSATPLVPDSPATPLVPDSPASSRAHTGLRMGSCYTLVWTHQHWVNLAGGPPTISEWIVRSEAEIRIINVRSLSLARPVVLC